MTHDWTTADFEALLEGGDAVADDGTNPLQRLGRTIAGQYVDVLIPFAQEVFRGPPGSSAVSALTEAMSALQRLVVATGDRVFADHLALMPSLIERATETHPARRSGFLRDMRSWILGVAEILDESDSEQLRTQFDAEASEAPLLEHLRDIPGMGKRRLQRLYCAGLYTADALRHAPPSDVAAVTGIPLDIAVRCVEASRSFASARRQQLLDRLGHDVAALIQLMNEPNPDNVRLARATAEETVEVLRRALAVAA